MVMCSIIPLIILQGDTHLVWFIKPDPPYYVSSLTVVHSVLLACSITDAPQQSAPTVGSHIYARQYHLLGTFV